MKYLFFIVCYYINIYICDMEKEIKKVYTVNIKPDLMKQFDQKAKNNKRSRSSEIELAIENHIKQNK